MKGKIIQFIKAEAYEAVLTDEGIVYERFTYRKAAPEPYKGAYTIEWTQWTEKVISIQSA